MLIQTSKSLNYGQRKPRQWGPLSAVQYAVRANAERMGIDPALLYGVWPVFEGAGTVVHDYINSRNLLPYSTAPLPDWRGQDLYFADNGNGVTNDILQATGSQFIPSLLADRMAAKEVTLTLRISTDLNNTATLIRIGYRQYFRANTNGSLNAYFTNTSYYGINHTTEAGLLQANKLHTISLRCNISANTADLFLDGVKFTSITTTLTPFTNSTSFTNTGVSIGRAWDWDNYYGVDGLFSGLIITRGCHINDSSIFQLHATPYALLMPVSRPIFFDLGSGGLQLTINNCSCTSSLSTPSLLEAATLLIDALSLQSSLQNVQLDLATILQVNSLAASATLAQANLVQKALLEIANLASTSSYSQADLLQAAILQVATLQVASQFTSVALLQKALLSVQGMLAGSFLSALSLSNASLLDVANLTVSQQLATLSLAQKAVLQLSALAVTGQLSSVGLLQDSQLAVNPMTVASWLEAIQLSSGLTLSVANLASSSSLSSVELLQKALLAMQQMQVTSNLTESQLSVAFELVVDSLLASGTISSPTLGVAFLLLVDNLGVASIIDNIQLGSEKFQLLVDSLLVGQTYSNISLVLPSDGYCLVITANSEQFTINATVEKFTIN